ncbi:conserved hypothetical protein [Parachlamydia acanthamoebae str. Hall's coccus]|nr:conserved hypothetical protein [Parachlamydia acanthamoebae str. Hall's coccus]
MQRSLGGRNIRRSLSIISELSMRTSHKSLTFLLRRMAMKKLSLILFFALCAFVFNSGYAQCGPSGCGVPASGGFEGGSSFAAPQGGEGGEAGACGEYAVGDCYCLFVKYEPRYCNKYRCEWDTQSYQVQRCRQVPETYQKTCCRYVPQYYQVDCVRYVPQYYCTTETRQVPRYVCDRECKYVPKYYYKRICNRNPVPPAPAPTTVTTPAPASCCGSQY